MEKLLVVEDKESMAQMLKETLELQGYEVIIASDGAEGIKRVRDSRVDAVITDLRLPKKNGLDVLKASKAENPLTPVIVMTAYGSVDTAVKAMKMGAYDFVTKPLDTDYLLLLIERSLTNHRLVKENMLLRDEQSQRSGSHPIVGNCPEMLKLAQDIKKVASAKTTVLLLGESGTGKELFARAVHELSPRKELPFVPINCAAIPGELLESELFGYEKGAFTGAADRKLGKLELGDDGTVFLDEIGELDKSLQSKMLRVLQEGEIDRVGGTRPVKVNIRIVAASNRDLESAVSEHLFREDLFYRLSVFPLTVPPLRNRKDDIPALVEHFVSKFSSEMNISGKHVTDDAMVVLKNYSWKGNVRELENVIERALILCDGDRIERKHFNLAPSDPEESLRGIASEGTLEEVAKAALRIAESRRIIKALDETNWNRTKAAEILKVSYKTLLTKIKDYGLDN